MGTCAECKHSKMEKIVLTSERKCKRLHPQTGDPIDSLTSCESQRCFPWPLDLLHGVCGNRGRFFEKKEEEND